MVSVEDVHLAQGLFLRGGGEGGEGTGGQNAQDHHECEQKGKDAFFHEYTSE